MLTLQRAILTLDIDPLQEVASTFGSVEPKHLLEAADAALNHAKANGRNQVVAVSETGFRVRAKEDENVRLLSERRKP